MITDDTDISWAKRNGELASRQFNSPCGDKAFKEQYEKRGYFLLRNAVPDEELSALRHDIARLAQMDGVKVMKEKDASTIRRLECIYNKTPALVHLNNVFSKILSDAIDEDVVLFKDKVNFKAPGSAGFRPHFDGTYLFDKDGEDKQGWYHYAPEFFNCLLAVDEWTLENGTLEISAACHYESFDDYLEQTYKDHTPHIREELANEITFEPIPLKPGDVLVFSPRCPHRSATNSTESGRTILYYTYNRTRDGNNYEDFFSDKFDLNPDTPKALQ